MANNWEGRQYIALGPGFKLESGNPTVGDSGSVVYDLYGISDNADVSLAGMTQQGSWRLYQDQHIEIVGGGKGQRGGVDVNIIGKQGAVTITAMENGDVRVSGANIIFESKKDIKFQCGGNLVAEVGNIIHLKVDEAYCDAPHTYGDNRLVEGEGSFLGGVFKNLAAEGIAMQAIGMAGKGNPAMAIAVNGGIKMLKGAFG